MSLAERRVNWMLSRDSFSQWLGIEFVSASQHMACVRATIREDMLNGFGVVHGGIAFSIADSAFAFAVNTEGPISVSIENSIQYPKAVMPGDILTATARRKSGGNKVSFYEVNVEKQDGDIVATFQGTAYRTKKEHEEK